MTKKTQSEGKTLEEANNINKSLMVLGKGNYYLFIFLHTHPSSMHGLSKNNPSTLVLNTRSVPRQYQTRYNRWIRNSYTELSIVYSIQLDMFHMKL